MCDMDDSAFRDFVERVRDTTDILEVIGGYVHLDRNHKGLCPFHPDKKPSFSVSLEGRFWHCFGCGASGDVFKFLELLEGKPFMTVVLELAHRAAISAPMGQSGESDRIKEERQIEEVLAEAAKFYHEGLTAEAKEYLTKKRGLTEDTIRGFRIGYASGGLRDYLTGKCGFSTEVCVKAGVLKKREDGEISDYFFERVIFPNLRHGRVVHLSGRRIDGANPKYLHLPGEKHYLYNEDALFNKEVLVTEGVTDCLSAVQAGYAAVATLGTSGFKPEHVSKFSHCEKVNICFDGDEAGREGALKVAALIGDKARIVELPEGLDPNDFLKDDRKDDFARLLTSAKDPIKFEISLIPADTNKTELPRRLEPILQRLATMSKAQAEAYLNYEIKPRFKLRRPDIDGYRESISKCREAGGSAPRCSPEQETNRVYAARFDGLVDLVEYEGNPAFLIKEDDRLVVVPEAQRDGVVYVPPPREQIPWLLPRGQEVLSLHEVGSMLPPEERDRLLYDDLLGYHREVSDLPTEEHYDLIVLWDLHTYLLDSFEYSPIISLFAVPERGKSRTGKAMIYVAYRGIHVESLRDAYLVRIASNFQGSIFFDVMDIWTKAQKNGTEDVLLQRFERGAQVPRVNYPDRGAYRDTVYYSIFGPTIIGTNEPVDRILETRGITINMPEASRQFDNDVTPARGLGLKERLVEFRARHLGVPFPDVPKIARGRLGDILRPLHQIVRRVRPEREAVFMRLVESIESARLVEKADTLEAQILTILLGLESQVDRGVLPVKLVTDTFNSGKPERAQISYQRVGRRLQAVGFTKCRVGNNSAIVWDKEKVERLVDAYGLRQTHETQERDETRAAAE